MGFFAVRDKRLLVSLSKCSADRIIRRSELRNVLAIDSGQYISGRAQPTGGAAREDAARSLSCARVRQGPGYFYPVNLELAAAAVVAAAVAAAAIRSPIKVLI